MLQLLLLYMGLWFLVVLGFWRMWLVCFTAALFAVSCGPSALCPLEMEAVAPPAVVVVEDAPEEDQKQVPEVQVVAADLQQQELQQQQQQPEKVFEENNVQEQVLHQVQVVGEQDGGLEVQERPEGVVAADAALSQEEQEKQQQQQEEQQKDGGGIAVSQKRDRDEQEKEVDKKWAGWPGDNVFRLVVPVQKVGGIIGRKGEFVKKMCEDTRSRIKILEGVPGTPERIV